VNRLRVAFLVTDKRQCDGDYANPVPSFGTAPDGLLAGFSELGYAQTTADKDHSFEIHVISCTQQAMPSPGMLGPHIWFHSLLVPKLGWLRTGYQGCIRAVGKKLREIQPDLVHAQGTERDCALSAVFSPHPKILTIHGNLRMIEKTIHFPPFSALWLQARLEGFAVPRFDGVVCISSYTRDAVAHETPKTWIVPNAVNPRFLEEGRQRLMSPTHVPSALSPEPPVILVVANICERKNQNSFIRSLDSLAAQKPFTVKFFGSTDNDSYSQEFHSLVSTRPWCRYEGFISPDALAKELRAATILGLPTHEDNCPMVVLEAQAAGVPVIASHVGGIPDLIEDQVTGLLINPRDPASMRDATDRLLTDANLRSTLAVNAHHRAMEAYHPRVIAQKHLDVYRQVLGD
jgi:glycosyltransferase involved in cell wall biosynthesis